MILSDSAILAAIKDGSIKIQPFYPQCLGCNSYDVHLAPELTTYDTQIIDSAKDNQATQWVIPEEGYMLVPGTLYLGSTVEYTETHKCVPFLEGKSSGGRLGISIHSTAGRGDVGFCSHWTLELSVIQPVMVYRYMPIGQLIYHTMQGEVNMPYNKKVSAHYSNQMGPVTSKMFDGIRNNPLARDMKEAGR